METRNNIESRPDRVSVRRLKLSDFRNYSELTLPLGPGHVVLTGENGSGKTNLIEALSFLSPGRGCGAHPMMMLRAQAAPKLSMMVLPFMHHSIA